MSPERAGTGQERMALDRALVLSLAVALRTAELYRADNAVALTVVQRLAEHFTRRTAYGPLEVEIRNRCVFAAGRRVRLTAADYPRLVYLMRVFEEWGIQGLTFMPSLTAEHLREFLWAAAHDRVGLPEALFERLGPGVVADIELMEPEGGRWSSPRREGGAGMNPMEDGPESTYLRALTVAQDANDSLRAGGTLAAKRIRRVTQSIVDGVISDPSSLLALTTIKDYDVYLLSHSINVAILASLLGLRLGFTKTQLGELVLAAFLHDIGKTRLPVALVSKPAALSDEEWVEMRRHPELGALTLIGQHHPTRSMMRALRVTLEHHMDYDLGGYPRVEGLTGASLFSRVIMVADRYDALTTPRPYRRRNFTPTEAIALMADQAGSGLDPVVLRHFVQMMGVYPVGTLLRLTGGAVGVVESPPPEGAPSTRPIIRLLADNSSIDLAEKDAQGTFLHQIAEVVNPGNVGQVPGIGPERLVLKREAGAGVA